jgi:hypothetical protein
VSWLRHAFAIEPGGPAAPNEQQRALVERLCAEIVRRQLAVPAVFLLEMSRPLNQVSAQLLHFFAPIAAVAVNADDYQQLAQFLERRGSVEFILQRLEAVEAERKGSGTPSDPTSRARAEVRGR